MSYMAQNRQYHYLWGVEGSMVTSLKQELNQSTNSLFSFQPPSTADSDFR